MLCDLFRCSDTSPFYPKLVVIGGEGETQFPLSSPSSRRPTMQSIGEYWIQYLEDILESISRIEEYLDEISQNRRAFEVDIASLNR